MTGVLTPAQHAMLRCSATGGAHPVRLTGAGNWRTARALHAARLGTICAETDAHGAPRNHFCINTAGLAALDWDAQSA